jgi:hypothetical protein
MIRSQDMLEACHDIPGKIMELPEHLIRGLILSAVFWTGSALACDPSYDGCLGCNDEELQICLEAFVAEVCDAGGSMARCDHRRVYDDVERHVLTSTGRHMSRVRAMMRRAPKYQLR